MAERVFFSYRRDDCAAYTMRIYDRFARHYGSKNVFIDTKKVRIGEKWRKKILEEVRRSDIFVITIGPKWRSHLESREDDDFLKTEILEALRYPGKLIVTFCTSEACRPNKAHLPGNMGELLDRQIEVLAEDEIDQRIGGLIRDIEEQLPQVRFEATHKPTIKADTRFPQTEVENQFASARDVIAVGIDLLGTLQNHRESIEQMLLEPGSDHVRIRLLMTDPDPEVMACEVIAKRGERTANDLREDIEAGLKEASRIAGFEQHKNCEIKLTDFPTAFGALGFNMESVETGTVFVWYYSYGTTRKRNYPVLVVPAREDRVMFDCLREQIENLWKDARSWNPKK